MQGVIENACHGEGEANVCRVDSVALSTTSSLCDCVCIALDLEDKSLKLLNTPASVGVNVEVKLTSGSNVGLCARFCCLVDGTDNFTVDFSKNLGAKDVSEFCFSVETVDCLEVLTAPSEYSPSGRVTLQ